MQLILTSSLSIAPLILIFAPNHLPSISQLLDRIECKSIEIINEAWNTEALDIHNMKCLFMLSNEYFNYEQKFYNKTWKKMLYWLWILVKHDIGNWRTNFCTSIVFCKLEGLYWKSIQYQSNEMLISIKIISLILPPLCCMYWYRWNIYVIHMFLIKSISKPAF